MCNYCATREAREHANHVEGFFLWEVCKSLRWMGLEYSGGEGGIRTPGTGFSQYNGLANRRLQPLGHLSAANYTQIVAQTPSKRQPELVAELL